MQHCAAISAIQFPNFPITRGLALVAGPTLPSQALLRSQQSLLGTVSPWPQGRVAGLTGLACGGTLGEATLFLFLSPKMLPYVHSLSGHPGWSSRRPGQEESWWQACGLASCWGGGGKQDSETGSSPPSEEPACRRGPLWSLSSPPSQAPRWLPAWELVNTLSSPHPRHWVLSWKWGPVLQQRHVLSGP